MSMPLVRRSFTVEEYHRMARAGVFAEGDRVELLDGAIVQMTPIGPEHSGCAGALTSNAHSPGVSRNRPAGGRHPGVTANRQPLTANR